MNAPCRLPLAKAMSFMQPHREIYALQSTVVHALLGLEEGEEAANVCSTRTHLCIASFLPAFRIPPRGPLWDIIRYMHKAENERTNECTNANAPRSSNAAMAAAPPSSPLHTYFLRALQDPKLKNFYGRGRPRRRFALHFSSEIGWVFKR